MVYAKHSKLSAVLCATRHVSAVKYTTSVDIQKHTIKSYSCRITCEHSESAQKRRIAINNNIQI